MIKKTRDGLLPRMEIRRRKDGLLTYRYHPIGGKPINLGTNRGVAIRKVLDLTDQSDDTGTIAALFREYQESRVWADLAPATQKDYLQCSAPLLAVFGAVQAAFVRPSDIATYLDKRSAPIRANREMALLSNLLALGIRRGLLDANPCRQVRRNKEQPRTRAVEPSELVVFLSWARNQGHSAQVLAGMAEFAALTGNRRIEFRALTWLQVSDDAVRLSRAKQRGKEVWEAVEITPALADLLSRMRALAVEPRIGYVFLTRGGGPYSEAGFKTMWNRLMSDARAEGVVSEPFTFHDLRAYHVTQYRKQRGTLPNLHSNPSTTARIYDRAKEIRRKGL